MPHSDASEATTCCNARLVWIEMKDSNSRKRVSAVLLLKILSFYLKALFIKYALIMIREWNKARKEMQMHY